MYFLLYFNILLFSSVNCFLNNTDSSDYIEEFSYSPFQIDEDLDNRSFEIATGGRRQNSFFGRRSPSISSIQELIRERLQNRPPSYYESQNSLNTGHNDEPPPYNEVATNTEASNCSSVYSISSKMPIPYVNNDPNLPCMECESDMDSPPSYLTSEGVHNPVLLRILDNNTGDSERDHYNLSIPEQEILHI